MAMGSGNKNVLHAVHRRGLPFCELCLMKAVNDPEQHRAV